MNHVFWPRSLALVGVAVVVGVVGAPTGSIAKEKTTAGLGLQLHVQFLPPEDTQQIPAILVSVANVGLADVWVSRRFAFNAPDAPLPFRDVWLEIKDRATGQQSSFSGEARVGFTSPQSLAVLGPAQAVGTWISLGPIFGMVHGRTYEIKAHWHNEMPAEKLPPKGVSSFSGELVAAPLVVKY